MKVQIKFIKFMYMFGRQIAVGQLQDADGKVILDNGSIAQMLTMIDEAKATLDNAQEVLDILVRRGGFAA